MTKSSGANTVKNKAPITTHVLNLGSGKPAAGMAVSLYSPTSNEPIASNSTDNEGRIMQWNESFHLQEGTWHLEFSTEQWFVAQAQESFFSNVRLSFKVSAGEAHYHVPLLLNAFGYSTYRGS